MDRQHNFLLLSAHPYLSKLYNQLSKNDLKFCIEFIDENKTLSDNDFIFKVNRLGLDKEKSSVNYDLIWAILIQSITPAIKQRRE